MRKLHRMIVLSLCVCVLPVILFSCKKSLGDRWVDSTFSVDVYADADELSAKVAQVPSGEKVEALQEKSDRRNAAVKWTEIRWNGKTGWLMSNNLKSSPIETPAPAAESSFPAETIIPLPELEAAAKEFYGNNLKKAVGEMQAQMTEELVARLHRFGYSVKYRVGDYAVVKHGSRFGSPVDDLESYTLADSLWLKKDGKWSEVIPCTDWGGQMYLYQMNNDEFPDVLVKQCVSENCSLTVYLGKADGTFDKVVAPDGIGDFPEVTGLVMKIGKCGGTSIELPESGGNAVISFDCAKNSLVKTKK